ncbi:LytTR family DNA-binding domain-containing protein [Sporosarcina sp. 179-K 3D1 HS]|uniref:LytR/AlgR family response regulator transcription factor n=1 Tax=Sporosarcina sp. 179-K 3D1 HS TaxID=3232169 RepID=UPI00399F58E5
MEKKVLQQYTVLMEDWIPKDASLAIAAGDRYIYYASGIHDIRLKEGQAVPPNSLAERTIRKGTKMEDLMDDTLFGVPYYGISYPIDIQGTPGALIVILPPNYHVLKSEPYRFLTGKQEDEWCPIAIEQVTHIESMQKKTWFYADEEQYSTNRTLKELHMRLPNTFLRIHRSYIVNISYIEKITRDFSSNFVIQLKNGTELPVSQKYMSGLRMTLGF